jgi:hypothetical protein
LQLPIILPVVLNEYETWCLTPVEEHRLRMPDDRILRRIDGPERQRK